MIYLDYAASTPTLPEISARYEEYCRAFFVNPHGVTKYAEHCRQAVLDAQRRILNALNIPEQEADIIWCGNGTEALNLAIFGTFAKYKFRSILVDPTAHPAILEPVRFLKCHEHCEVTSLKSDNSGVLQPRISSQFPTLLCVCHANNETGQIQPLAELRKSVGAKCVFCVDGIQSCTKIPIPWGRAGIDLLAISSRKIGGPGGIGALIVRRGMALVPRLLGGGQQKNLRSGTIDTVSVKLFADSVQLSCEWYFQHERKIRVLRRMLEEGLRELGGESWHFFSTDSGLPHIFSFGIPKWEGALVARILAEKFQILIGTGSACSAESKETSHVLQAMGIPKDIAREQLRISLGVQTTPEEIRALLEALRRIVCEKPFFLCKSP